MKIMVVALSLMLMNAWLNAAEPDPDLKTESQKRFMQDRRSFNAEQQQEIESLYKLAAKGATAPGARAALKKLTDKYPRANRTGCAILSMGLSTKHREREKYLLQAIDGFNDCFYGDRVQVGPYARFCLGTYYLTLRRDKEAKALFEEIKKDYPNAIDHQGLLLVEQIPKNLK